MAWSPNDFEGGFVARILASSAVSDIVDDRMLPLAEAANPGYPCIVYETSYDFDPALDGGVWKATVDIFSFSKSYDGACTLANAIRGAMEGSGSDGGRNFACGTNVTVRHWITSSINRSDFSELTDVPIYAVLLRCDALLDTV